MIDDDKPIQNERSASATLALKDFAKAASMDGAAIAAAVAMTPRTEKADFVGKMIQPALERLKARLHAGDKRGLLEALAICFAVETPVPSWLTEAFLGAYHSVPKTWDDVFGRPRPKGHSVAKARRNKEIRFKLYCRVEERHARGEAKDNELFADIGKEFRISRATAQRYYRQFCEAFEGKEFQHPYLQSVVESLVPRQTAPIADPSESPKKWQRGKRLVAALRRPKPTKRDPQKSINS
jgi:hypothetical protein